MRSPGGTASSGGQAGPGACVVTVVAAPSAARFCAAMARSPRSTASWASDFSGAVATATIARATSTPAPATTTVWPRTAAQVPRNPLRRTGISIHRYDASASANVTPRHSTTFTRVGSDPGAVAGSSAATRRITGQCQR